MSSSKVCFKCSVEKPTSEFYKHPKMADGLLGKCKGCTKADVGENRIKNLDRIRKYDRDRAKNPERAKAAAEVSAAWRAEDSRRAACHNAVQRAIRSGALTRMPCSRCSSVKAYAHHESYDRKLDVTWLCQPCHKKRHKEMVQQGIIP